MHKGYYLAGPMAGRPQFNYPAFFKGAEILRGRGFTVISPAELDDPATRAEALANANGDLSQITSTWGDFLSRDVKIVADKVSGIILMPDWEKSRGARLEATVGLLCKHDFLAWKDPELIEVPSEIIIHKLYKEFLYGGLKANKP